jgi:hypothetical protein
MMTVRRQRSAPLECGSLLPLFSLYRIQQAPLQSEAAPIPVSIGAEQIPIPTHRKEVRFRKSEKSGSKLPHSKDPRLPHRSAP